MFGNDEDMLGNRAELLFRAGYSSVIVQSLHECTRYLEWRDFNALLIGASVPRSQARDLIDWLRQESDVTTKVSIFYRGSVPRELRADAFISDSESATSMLPTLSFLLFRELRTPEALHAFPAASPKRKLPKLALPKPPKSAPPPMSPKVSRPSPQRSKPPKVNRPRPPRGRG